MLLFSLVLICCQGRSQERIQGVPEILSLCMSSNMLLLPTCLNITRPRVHEPARYLYLTAFYHSHGLNLGFVSWRVRHPVFNIK